MCPRALLTMYLLTCCGLILQSVLVFCPMSCCIAMPGCSWSGATSLPFWLLVIRIRPADVYLRCQENGRFTSIPAHITVVGRCSPHVQGRYDRHQELIFRLYPSGYYPSGLGVSRVSFVNLDHWTADIIRKCLSIFDMGNYTDGAYRRICPSFMSTSRHNT